LDNDRWF